MDTNNDSELKVIIDTMHLPGCKSNTSNKFLQIPRKTHRLATWNQLTWLRRLYYYCLTYIHGSDSLNLGIRTIRRWLWQVVHPADMCFKLPENVSLEEGAMCEPLSVGVHACRRARVGPETRVLVIGGGAIGLVTLLVAKAFGSPRVVLADTHSERLSFAKQLGADEVVLISRNAEVVSEP